MLTHWSHINRLLNDFAGHTKWQAATPAVCAEGHTAWVSSDIYETEEALVLVMDVPGLRSEDVEVLVEDRVLKISGARARPTPEDATQHRRERRFGSFSRSFRLGTALDPADTVAGVEEGVLTVTVPKSTDSKALRIDVS